MILSQKCIKTLDKVTGRVVAGALGRSRRGRDSDRQDQTAAEVRAAAARRPRSLFRQPPSLVTKRVSKIGVSGVWVLTYTLASL